MMRISGINRRSLLKRVTVLLCVLFIHYNAVAQDKDIEARAYYGKAEEAYNGGSYSNALKYIKKAEEKLGSTNPTLLYLQINIYNKLSENAWRYLDSSRNSLKKFFEITDKSVYPQEKYLEMINLKIDIDDKLSKLAIKRKNYLEYKARQKIFLNDTIKILAINFCKAYNEMANSRWNNTNNLNLKFPIVNFRFDTVNYDLISDNYSMRITNIKFGVINSMVGENSPNNEDKFRFNEYVYMNAFFFEKFLGQDLSYTILKHENKKNDNYTDMRNALNDIGSSFINSGWDKYNLSSFDDVKD